MITCRFEDGKEAMLRHVVADVVGVDDAGRVLLVRRAPFLVEGGKLALPGGYMDLGETWEQCARREFLEETGRECHDMRLVHIDSRPNRRGDHRFNVVGVFVATAGERVREPDAESTELQWVDLDEAAARDDLAFDHAGQIAVAVAHLRENRLGLSLDGEYTKVNDG